MPRDGRIPFLLPRVALLNFSIRVIYKRENDGTAYIEYEEKSIDNVVKHIDPNKTVHSIMKKGTPMRDK